MSFEKVREWHVPGVLTWSLIADSLSRIGKGQVEIQCGIVGYETSAFQHCASLADSITDGIMAGVSIVEDDIRLCCGGAVCRWFNW